MNRLFWLLVGCLMVLMGCTSVTVENPAPPFEPVEEEDVLLGNSAESQGFDPDMLAQIPAYVEDRFPHLYSVLVLRNGELVHEYYADGQSADTPAVVWSVTKSFVSALVGIAIEEGLIMSVDQTLDELIPLYLPIDGDPRLNEVTLRQLLTMSSGMFCNRDGCHDNSISQTTSADLQAEPGERFAYDTGASHLISAILTEATSMTTYEYAEMKLFEPLAFERHSWETDSEGLYFGGKGLSVRPRDMAKFGQLFLDGGVWDGEQLVPESYIQESTVDQLGGISAETEYGYLWWPSEVEGHDAYAAVGFGGQYITVVPDLELVVVITSNFSRPRNDNNAIIYDLIVPAIID